MAICSEGRCLWIAYGQKFLPSCSLRSFAAQRAFHNSWGVCGMDGAIRVSGADSPSVSAFSRTGGCVVVPTWSKDLLDHWPRRAGSASRFFPTTVGVPNENAPSGRAACVASISQSASTISRHDAIGAVATVGGRVRPLFGKRQRAVGQYSHLPSPVREALVVNGDRVRPRIHDLRHTFATRLIAKWSQQRSPLAHHLLLLCRYLGHQAFEQTFWYVSSDAKAFNRTSQQFNSYCHSAHDRDPVPVPNPTVFRSSPNQPAQRQPPNGHRLPRYLPALASLSWRPPTPSD